MSVKRRRGIGMRKWLVAALKDVAKRQSAELTKPVSHTSIANEILRGKLPPISAYEKYKENGDCAKQGVSMQEELWLAVKEYSKERAKGEGDAKISCKIIVGKIPPVPEHCIEAGKRLARQREKERAGTVPAQKKSAAPKEPESPFAEWPLASPKSKKKPKKKAKKKKREKAFSKKALEKAENDIAKRVEEGSPELDGASGLPPGMSSREFLDVVQESQEEGILEARAEKKLGEDGRELSKGEPIGEQDSSKDREIKPDDDFYSGVFNM